MAWLVPLVRVSVPVPRLTIRFVSAPVPATRSWPDTVVELLLKLELPLPSLRRVPIVTVFVKADALRLMPIVA
jgi:hypothetical protein